MRMQRVALLNIWSFIMYMDTVLEWNYCTFCALKIVHFIALWKGTKSNGTTIKSYSLSRSSPKDFLIAKIQAIWLIHAKDEVNLKIMLDSNIFDTPSAVQNQLKVVSEYTRTFKCAKKGSIAVCDFHILCEDCYKNTKIFR